MLLSSSSVSALRRCPTSAATALAVRAPFSTSAVAHGSRLRVTGRPGTRADSVQRVTATEVSALPSTPLAPTPIKLKAKSVPKLLPAVAKLADGTTVHVNAGAYEPQFSRSDLPPVSHRFAATSLAGPGADPIDGTTATRLAADQVVEMRALRAQDPETWTVRALAKKFGVSGIFVSRSAPCPEPRALALAVAEQERVARLPPSTLQHIRDRQRRRALW
ncbi:mitochondrial ribosomal protein subunit L20-domain-containing protein [Blastocladiella britannica]|nr:mitochondrial ribosomal protein subunit L20-domain-containing protein [Blastocladiella britannica]